ncbi:MAG: NAD(P)/FAD-dependent oxidoreductase [Opitutales bacterium]
MKTVTIAGGGVAGLALGVALRQRQVPVTVLEAGTYPRHRVCGEFLCGRGAQLLEALGLGSLESEAVRHRQTGWYVKGRNVLAGTLPKTALGISRHTMDVRLAEHFQALGGELCTQARAPRDFGGEGQVRATGRQIDRASDWLGLKLHVHALATRENLEVHLGAGGYVGVSAVEAGAVNVCGLFRKRDAMDGRGVALMLGYLRACGLDALARRIEQAEPEAASVVGISHFSFGQAQEPQAAVGDALTVIPPFTGNGMSMALEAAWQAAPVLEAYARRRTTWPESQLRLRRVLGRNFRRRVRWARGTQTMLLLPWTRTGLSLCARGGVFPFQTLFRLTHS